MFTTARLARLCLPLLVVLVVALPAGADDSWKDTEGYKQLLRLEAKVLRGLLKTAVKEEYRRQTWYLADRLLAADPENEKALAALETWNARELIEGEEPKKAFVSKRDSVLRGLGDDVFHFGETLDGAGVDPVDYYEISQRAHLYGSQAGPLLAALEGAGYVWLGTYLDREEESVRALLGPELMTEVRFPHEFDDAYLKYRANWPDTKVARWGDWRIVTDQTWEEGLRTVALVADIERWVMDSMGKGKTSGEVTDFAVFRQIETYDKIGPDYVRENDSDLFLSESSWYSLRQKRALLSAVHRDNPWVAPASLVQGMVGRVLARTRLSNAATGWVSGRGYWLLDGMQGAFEGLRRTDDGSFELDPKICWQLCAARALRDTGQLMPWEDFFKLDWNALRDTPRVPTLTIYVNGAAREAQNVDVAAAQATAVAVGVFLSDRKKGPKALAKLIGEYFKRDVLPNCDKVLKWKAGRVVEEAYKAVDAVPVPD